jgi:hypothetical protein
MDRVYHSVPDNLFIYCHTHSSLLLHLPSVISLKSSLLLLQKFLTESLSTDPVQIHIIAFSHLYCMFLFLFGLLIFTVKLKYNNNRVYRSYYKDDYVADQCVSRKSNSEHFN